ncbi:hypothetical protein [Caproiciproducens galactitolivorans]|uniref:DUF4829 domain-containing protein n=1 Tax=Caproiciproducens galactitolivorans TaxID=642589 RepID=A0ABT4BR13_9FIRM|nr:hypothetical protein [Caproiciproducens galactitolivorans]MCY1713327.1 hypothetical protein [Caproiciproducens galactitolivorans]
MCKRLFPALFILLIILGASGCSYTKNSDNTISSGHSTSESTLSSNSSVLSLSSNESVSSYDFSDEEIESAKKIAEAYYKRTIWKPKSYQFDKTNCLYGDYSKKYDKDRLVVFTVTIENSEDPPRGIALVRADSNSDWKVVGEGY